MARSAPADPVTPAEPAAPAEPAESATPAEPVPPDRPVEPTQATGSDNQGTTEKAATPAQPVTRAAAKPVEPAEHALVALAMAPDGRADGTDSPIDMPAPPELATQAKLTVPFGLSFTHMPAPNTGEAITLASGQSVDHVAAVPSRVAAGAISHIQTEANSSTAQAHLGEHGAPAGKPKPVATAAPSVRAPTNVTVTQTPAPLHSSPSATLSAGTALHPQQSVDVQPLRADRADPVTLQQPGGNAGARAATSATPASASATVGEAANGSGSTADATTRVERPAVPTAHASHLAATQVPPSTRHAASPTSDPFSIAGQAFARAHGATAAAAMRAPARPMPAARAAFEQIAVNIQRAAAAGTDRIEIRLQPPELGRVDVRLEVKRDQRLRAVILAEKPETLDLLQRDARQLQRALQMAGLQADTGSLEFGLSGGSSDAGGFGAMQGDGTNDGALAGETDAADGYDHGEIPHVIADDHVDIRV